MLTLLLLSIVSFVHVKGCYWNAQCPYGLFASKTPYDTIRGDIRDYATPENCEAVSIWTIHRHGNRNPGTGVTANMKGVVGLKDEIIASYDAGRSQLCAQDIENFRNWSWNSTLDESQSFLTGTGYEELYNIAMRIREKYAHLLQGSEDQFYFRPTDEQRTITSCMAFVHGLTEGVNLNVTVKGPRSRDDILRPYQHCDRYQQEVKGGASLAGELDNYFKSREFLAVQNAVQQRLGISTQLSAENILSIYEICRFFRSWTDNLQDPWCAAFTNEDVIVMEYYDDVRHYHRNGYGSWVNVELGKSPMKDLYEKFEAVVNGESSSKVVSYFTHDTMLEMAYCALGLYRDPAPLQGAVRDPERLWRSSYVGAFSVNMIAVLNSCNESGRQTHKVQLFINEKETALCPKEGCSWQQFQDKFQIFTLHNLSFCEMDYVYDEPTINSAVSVRSFLGW